MSDKKVLTQADIDALLLGSPEEEQDLVGAVKELTETAANMGAGGGGGTGDSEAAGEGGMGGGGGGGDAVEGAQPSEASDPPSPPESGYATMSVGAPTESNAAPSAVSEEDAPSETEVAETEAPATVVPVAKATAEAEVAAMEKAPAPPAAPVVPEAAAVKAVPPPEFAQFQASLTALNSRFDGLQAAMIRIDALEQTLSGLSDLITKGVPGSKTVNADMKRLAAQVDRLSQELRHSFGVSAKHGYSCDSCGHLGEVAAHVKCTHCGKDGLWGWWPPEGHTKQSRNRGRHRRNGNRPSH